MKRLIFIRHGETDYTLREKCCGQIDMELNAKGIAQAKRLRTELNGIKIDRVYASDLKRAYQTAQIIFNNKTILKRKGLRELDFGHFSGLTYKQINRLYPKAYKTLMNDLAKAKPLGGESIRHFVNRVERCFNRIFNQNAKNTVAIVSHIGPIRIIHLKIQGENLSNFWEIQQNPGSFRIIEFRKENKRGIKINSNPLLKAQHKESKVLKKYR